MTKIIKENEEVDCPVCNKTHLITFYDSVNIRLNPELRKKVFNREINCLPCAYGAPIGPFLYVDENNRWIWLYPKFMQDRIVKIELEVQRQQKEHDRMFGDDQVKIYLVFGYDRFFELLDSMDKV